MNFKTPVHEIIFRSSRIGLIVGGIMRHGLTDAQRKEMESLELARITPIGLTEKQQSDLNEWDKKIESGGNLTPSQMEKRDEYKKRLVTPKGLTQAQYDRLKDLQEKNAKEPELSDGAKTEVELLWLENEKGFKEEVTDKKLKKGTQAEEDGINLISFIDGVMHFKNTERITKGHLTGECDVIEYNKEVDAKIIHDIKCSWNPRTFMSASLTTAYEWQGRAYLYLYDADIFRLRFCLVDCPPDVYLDELKRFCWQHNIIDETLPEYADLIAQFERNYLYENSGLYSKHERVKSFMFERDFELEEKMLFAINLAVEYYQTITLNQIRK